jgi:NAD(P)-dependent dehydrogenase (short-subunit alcohol dehydrogenase family)
VRVLVTGGARRIGAGIVRHLAAAGHRLAIHHHDSHDEADALAAETGGTVLSADLADPDAAPTLIAAAAQALGGPVEGLVNNASIFEWDDHALPDLALLDRLMHVNAAAPVRLAVALAAQPGLEDGAVVNLLDQKVANLNPDFFSYTMSKLALAGATEMLARALAPRVRVNALSPGLTLPSLDQSDAEFAATNNRNLLGRPVALDDIAATVAHLLATRSITGQNIFVDCGQRFLRREGDVMFETRERPHG